MKNFWLNKKEKKKEELNKKIEYINKLLMQFNYEDSIFLVNEVKGKQSA